MQSRFSASAAGLPRPVRARGKRKSWREQFCMELYLSSNAHHTFCQRRHTFASIIRQGDAHANDRCGSRTWQPG